MNFQAGLIVYWITTNVWTIGQQLLVKKLYPKPAPREPSDGRRDGGRAWETAAYRRWPPRTSRQARRRGQGAAAKAAAAKRGDGNGAATKPPPNPRKKKKRSGRRR